MQESENITELPYLRRQKILMTLERDGKILASELSQQFGVSEDTIRRDLNELGKRGLLHRVHGGALPRSADSGKDYLTRQRQPDDTKHALAQEAARWVQDGQVVVFDSGTTTLQIAQSLPWDINLTVVTNSPPIVMALVHHRKINVIAAGGQLNRDAMALTGHEAVKLMQSVRADIVFLGICALHPEVGITIAHPDELSVKQAMLDGASQVIAVTMADKLGTVEPFVVGPVTRVDTLITERHIPSGDLGVYQQLGIEVQQAG